MKDHDETLVKYKERCEIAAAEEFHKSMNNGFSKRPYFNELLSGSGKREKHENASDGIENVADGEDTKTCYLRLLLDINKIIHDDKYADCVTDIFSAKTEELSHDKLLGNVLQTKYLRPALDIWVENMPVLNTSPKVIEISDGEHSDGIIDQIKTNFLLKPTFRFANTSDTQTESNSSDDKTGDVHWELDKDAPEDLKNAQLVIVNNIARKQKNVKKTLASISQLLDVDGFILLHEVTTNFAIAAPLDGLYCDKVKDIDDLADRTCSIYCDRAKWLKQFEEEGLQVVYEVTDNLLSSLFLLRKEVETDAEKQVILNINDPGCSWVDDLKSKVEEVGQSGHVENLWVLADNERSGILGLENCLVREAGSRMR